jgi:hypothetical protein
MKKDIKFPPVEGVLIAVAKESDELNSSVWNVYLINRNPFVLDNIFVRSKGYGLFKEEKQETSVLRHHIPRVDAGEMVLVEPIDPALFHLNNEYWVSYFIGNQIFDKKFIFLPESIIDANLTHIPDLNIHAILHS